MAMTSSGEGGASAHNVILKERKTLTSTGVSNVDSFDEETVVAYTALGELTIRGRQLKIQHLDVQAGELTVEGEILSLHYTDNQPGSAGFFKKLFR